ncbi:hypothetical protein ACLOJK_001210, partial [Asimina triloba]
WVLAKNEGDVLLLVAIAWMEFLSTMGDETTRSGIMTSSVFFLSVRIYRSIVVGR